MKNSALTILASCFLICSCSQNESEGLNEISNNEFIVWNKDLDPSINRIKIYDPIIYQDILIYPKMESLFLNGEIIALNKNTGETLWTWSEGIDKFNKNGFSADSYAYDGVLAIGDNNYTAGINIYTGETLWENLEEDYSLAAIHGAQETIFKSRYIPNEKYWIEKANIHTGQWETIYELDREGELKMDSNLPMVIEENDKIYITFLKSNWIIESGMNTAYHFLHLYNVTDDYLEWKSDTIPVDYGNSGIPGVFPTYNEGKILLSNDAIFAYNFDDGRLAWKKYYGNSFTFTSRITAGDGRVYGNNGGNYFVGLDVHSGEEIFRVDSGGSPSRVVYHEGKCYLSAVTKPSGGNFFMVIDGVTGDIIHEFNASENLGESAIFDWALTVDPETGYAYTSDYKNALCFNFE